MAAGTVIIAGSVAQRPGRGGHTWVFLQYLLGFKDLGWDAILLDRLEPEMCFDADGQPCGLEDSVNLRYLQDVLRGFDLAGSYALLYDRGKQCLGLSRAEIMERVESASLLINVNGFITAEEILSRARLRVFLDIDPGFAQMWRALGLHDAFPNHDIYLTVGENIGQPDCTIPTCGLEWVTTPQPVVLESWPSQSPGGKLFTSVGSWRGPFGPIEYRGVTYGLRVHECRKFAELPRRSDQSFELALDIDSADAKDIELLRSHGWSLTDPSAVADDPSTYRQYVQGSKAELMIAKNMYVRSRSGWFSDRSICYLASGKPVLAQETGFSRRYPTAEGLLSFSDLDEAVAGAAEIASNYDRHARAARALADEHFDSRKVLGRLLDRLEVA
jgi:hypothetical protein